jgi:hypothetical protein
MRSIFGYGKMPLGVPSHVLQNFDKHAGGRLHGRLRVTSPAPPVSFLCMEYDICREVDMRLRNGNNAPVISPIEHMYDIRDASGVCTDDRSTVSSRVGQRVVWQVVLQLAEEAWRARLPLAFKLHMHAREKLGEKPAVSGSSGKRFLVLSLAEDLHVKGQRVQGRSDFDLAEDRCAVVR